MVYYGKSQVHVNSAVISNLKIQICVAGAASVYGIGFREERWEQWGELALAGFSGLCSVALFVMTFSSNIWISYASFIVFTCLYMVLMTIAM